VFALKLAERRWAYVRAYKGGMGLFPLIGTSSNINITVVCQRFTPRWFFCYLTDSEDPTVVIKVGHVGFPESADLWIPPYFRPPDLMDRRYTITHRDRTIRCDEADTRGIAPFARLYPAGIKQFFLEKLTAGELEEIESTAISEGESNAPSISSEEATEPYTSSLKLEAQAAIKYARKLPKATSLQSSLVALSRAMNLVFDDHGEITDTEIREQMFDVIFQGFIHQTPSYVVPETFDADSPEGDAAIRAVLTAFLKVAIPLAAREGVDTPETRLDAFNSDSSLELDEFFGWMEHLKPLKD